jgi:hypothetical protein
MKCVLSRAEFLKLLSVEEPLRVKTQEKIRKETVVSALRLLQYFQLPDKNSRDLSRYIYNFFFPPRYFKIVMYLFHYFSRNPKCCSVERKGSAEPNSTNTGVETIRYKYICCVKWVTCLPSDHILFRHSLWPARTSALRLCVSQVL